MGERPLHRREEQYTGREPAVPEFQVQLLRIMYKWLFFFIWNMLSLSSCQIHSNSYGFIPCNLLCTFAIYDKEIMYV